jgi:hypothetical protein
MVAIADSNIYWARAKDANGTGRWSWRARAVVWTWGEPTCSCREV